MRMLLGMSAEGREIPAFSNFLPGAATDHARSTLLVGGTHGDERATVSILESFVRTRLDRGEVKAPVAVIPLLNPDGFARNSRYNGKGVDLNRNFPHNWSPSADEPSGERPLSEPETRHLHAFILSYRPAKIISLHWALSEIDADGIQSAHLARRMWEALDEDGRKPYRLRVQTHAKAGGCPGSLGQWCGHGLHYPEGRRPAMVTLELPYHPHRHERPEELPENHLSTLRVLWESRPYEYLAGVEEGVHRVLAAACHVEHIAALLR
jgi:hypothetical protein